MAKVPNQVYTTQNFVDGRLTLTSVNGIVPATLITAGANDTLVYEIFGTNTGTTQKILYLYLDSHLMCQAIIDPQVGHSATTRTANLLFNLDLPVDGNGNRFLPLKAGAQLKVGMKVALDPGEIITVTCLGEDY